MARLIALILALSVSLTAFAACGYESTENDEEKLRQQIAGINPDAEEEDGDYDLVVAYYGYNVFEVDNILPNFEAENDVKVKTLQFEDGDVTALNTMLMSGDSGIDIFFTATIDIYNYIKTGYYTDLSQFEGLKSRIESSEFTKFAASYNGEYFGIPSDTYYFESEGFEQNGLTFEKYIYKNINALEGTYSDPNGEELYSVLRYLYDNPEDPAENPYYADYNYKVCTAEYFIINPYSENKDLAAKFLEIVYDYNCGDFTPLDGKGNPYPASYIQLYPEVEDMTGAQFSWNSNVWSIIEPVRELYNSLSETDGSDETLKRLASEAAGDVVMRLQA